jgi:hypothetical protein
MVQEPVLLTAYWSVKLPVLVELIGVIDCGSSRSSVRYRDSGGVGRIQVSADGYQLAHLGVEAGTGKNDYTRRLVYGETCPGSGTATTIVVQPSGF